MVLAVLVWRRMPYPPFAVNVESWMTLELPVIWTPSGLFSATTELSMVVPPTVWSPPPPDAAPEIVLERKIELSTLMVPPLDERPAPLPPNGTELLENVQSRNRGAPLSTCAPPPEVSAKLPVKRTLAMRGEPPLIQIPAPLLFG